MFLLNWVTWASKLALKNLSVILLEYAVSPISLIESLRARSAVCIKLIKANSSLLLGNLGLKDRIPLRPDTAAALYAPHIAFFGPTLLRTIIGSTNEGIAARPRVVM